MIRYNFPLKDLVWNIREADVIVDLSLARLFEISDLNEEQ